ncbi:small multi-drug export protein [Salisediminibacterium selenitireducens]|uniref:small multi-drug export protein n=1 Tax=Salisediminibacterium selenitireducens TaxID=85683 RepID=UPI00030D5F8E|nr:small multi-drug export protein [Salisediminibacterium selenitireducens]
MFEILWQYTLVFVLAATPWMEILVVIPIGIGIGLDPFLVAIISFAGNFLPIVLIIWLLNWFKTTNMYAWWQKRKHGKKEKKHAPSRGQRVFQKYGLPGLAFLGPLLTGIHLAAIIALSLKATKAQTTVWMAISLFVWTLFLTIASVYSIDFVTDWFTLQAFL